MAKKPSVPNKVIEKEILEDMFASMRKQANIHPKQKLLWGYFFTHTEPTLLEKASDLLLKKGYDFVEIYETEKDSPESINNWWLHVEKIEKHTVSSLDKRNDEFYLFAHNLGLFSYDGMDVGPVTKA